MTASAQNSQSDSDKLPKDESLGVATHNSSAGDAVTDSGSRKSKSQTTATILFESGHRIRDYELLELLGQGGMGSVWKAKHTRLKKFVALKLLPQEKTSDEAAVARFNREMEAVGALRHPHIIEAHDAGEENGTHYLVMEYVAGIELAALSKKVGQFPIADACELMRQTALGLQHAFEHGLVHRDIKPSNLLLAVPVEHAARVPLSSSTAVFDDPHTQASRLCHIKILDLGLALLHGDQPAEELTSTGQVMGTLDYIAPEQLADTHAVDIRADLYSLGCTLFRLLTTEPPFAGPSLNTAARKMFAHSFTPAPKLLDRRPDVPAELSALVARLLEKQPAARFATPREVATALAPFCVGHNLPVLLASSSSAPTPSDPFASTVLPNVAVIAPRDEPSVIDPQPTIDAPPLNVGWDSIPTAPTSAPPTCNSTPTGRDGIPTYEPRSTASRATELLSSNDVDRALGSSRGAMTATLNAASPHRRPVVIIAALLAIVLLSVFLPPLLKRDASLTETTTTNPGEPGGVSPRTNPNTTDVRGLTPPGSPSSKSEISNSKSQIPADSERAAVEWVLSLKSPVTPPVVRVKLPDFSHKTLSNAAELPAGPYSLEIIIVAAAGVDDAAVAKYLAPLKSLISLRLQECAQITDKSLSVLQRSPMLIAVFLNGSSGLSSKGILTLSQSLPMLQIVGVDGAQFSPELATWLAKTPRVTGFHFGNGSDEQLRQLLDATHLGELVFNFNLNYQSNARHSTWARLPDKLRNLRLLNLHNGQLQDADLIAFTRFPELEILNLNGNREVTDVGLAQLAAAAKLKHLEVSQTAVTPLGLADFLESHPACQVVWDGADHRAVAEWVLSVGGKVQVAGRGAEWLDAAVPVAHAARVSPPKTPLAAPPADTASAEDQQTHASRVSHRLGGGPVLLTGVDLSGLGTLKDADLARLADCTTLRDLQLHNASLTGACLTHLKALMRLRNLNLAGLSIEDQDLVQLTELKQLQTLNLKNSKITNAGMLSLSGLTELITLGLNGTAVTTDGLEALMRLPNLLWLDLIKTSADDRTVELLCKFPSLRTVGLSDTRITDDGLKRLAQRQLPCDNLYLANLPTLTDAILMDLRSQQGLISLDLSQTKVTPTAFEAFVREHPRLGMTLATDDSEAPDLRVARGILAVGGEIVLAVATPQPSVPLAVSVTWSHLSVRRIEDLPKEPFRITQIDLRLAGAKVTDETLAEVGRLELLGYIHTVDAVISNKILAEIASAPKLVWLNLSGTALSSSTVQQLSTNSTLKQLALVKTGLDGPAVARLAALANLKELAINANTLTDDDITFVEKLTELERLEIGGTQIVNHGWASIAKLPKLKVLRAYNMPVTDEALRHAGQIESLEYLAVGSSEVSDAGLQHLRSLRHLRELYLSHCRRLTDAGLESLAELPALETLHLNATPITDAGLKHLAKIKTLKSLNLTDCKLSATAIDDLQDALPWCRIQKSP